jgi:hypothetical protein
MKLCLLQLRRLGRSRDWKTGPYCATVGNKSSCVLFRLCRETCFFQIFSMSCYHRVPGSDVSLISPFEKRTGLFEELGMNSSQLEPRLWYLSFPLYPLSSTQAAKYLRAPQHHKPSAVPSMSMVWAHTTAVCFWPVLWHFYSVWASELDDQMHSLPVFLAVSDFQGPRVFMFGLRCGCFTSTVLQVSWCHIRRSHTRSYRVNVPWWTDVYHDVILHGRDIKILLCPSNTGELYLMHMLLAEPWHEGLFKSLRAKAYSLREAKRRPW